MAWDVVAFISFGETKTEYLRDALGSNELAVDGRASQGGPLEFTYTVPDKWVFRTDRITFVVVDNGNLNAERFGAIAALSIGVDLEMLYKGSITDLLGGIGLNRNGDFAKLAGQNIREFGNRRGLVADWSWDGDEVLFKPGTTILARINDNLSRLISFTIALKGKLISE